MNDLINLLEGRKNLKLGGITAGGGVPAGEDLSRGTEHGELIESNDQIFKIQLKSILKNSDTWFKIIFIILILLIIFISVIIWEMRTQKTYVIALLSGTQGVSIVTIIRRLNLLYDKKRTSELLLFLYQAAETEKERQKTLGELITFLKKT